MGDRRDVPLVSYQRDLGVWIFPGVRRKGFLLTISIRCMLSLYLNTTNAIDSKKKTKKNKRAHYITRIPV